MIKGRKIGFQYFKEPGNDFSKAEQQVYSEGSGKVSIELKMNEKLNLSVTEAAAFSGIGIHKIRALMQEPDCDFVLCVGTKKKLIKRGKFEKYLSVHEHI